MLIGDCWEKLLMARSVEGHFIYLGALTMILNLFRLIQLRLAIKISVEASESSGVKARDSIVAIELVTVPIRANFVPGLTRV